MCEVCYVHVDLFAGILPVDTCVEARSQLQISSILLSTCLDFFSYTFTYLYICLCLCS